MVFFTVGKSYVVKVGKNGLWAKRSNEYVDVCMGRLNQQILQIWEFEMENN
jgi:hypothetical protein